MSVPEAASGWLAGMTAPGSGGQMSIMRLHIAKLMRRNENSN